MGGAANMINGKECLDAIGYRRVSTHHPDQQLSMIHQQDSIEKYCADKKIYLHKIFSDNEVSAKSNVNRYDYQEMLLALERIKPAYLIVKDNDRLNRNTEGNDKLLRICRNTGTKILYLLDNSIIDPNNINDLMRNGFTSLMGQNYSLQQHLKGKNAHEKKVRDLRLSAQNNCYGYRYNKSTRQMEIVEEEAEIIKFVFESYVYKGWGARKIADELAKKGIKGFGSHELISENGILNWLKKTAYIGKMAFNTKGSTFKFGEDEATQRFARPKEEWVYADVPPIIDIEIFEMAQQLRLSKNRRTAGDLSTPKRFSGTHIYCSKIFCECGESMVYRDGNRAKTVGIYRCLHKKRKENHTCRNPYSKIPEATLNSLLLQAVEAYADKETVICEQIMAAAQKVLTSEESSDDTKKNKLMKEIENHKKKLKKIESTILNVSGDLQVVMNQQYQETTDAISDAEKELARLSAKESPVSQIEARLQKIRNAIQEMRQNQTVDREYTERYLDKIIMHEDGEIEVRLLYNETYIADNPQKKSADVDTNPSRHDLYSDIEAYQ